MPQIEYDQIISNQTGWSKFCFSPSIWLANDYILLSHMYVSMMMVRLQSDQTGKHWQPPV